MGEACGFDEQLGPGGRLRSGEDRDLAARALAAGWWVLQIPDAFVIHHGFRTWLQGRSRYSLRLQLPWKSHRWRYCHFLHLLYHFRYWRCCSRRHSLWLRCRWRC